MRLLALAFLLVIPLFSEPLLWYDRPADQWVEALPVGNGRLGGMVFGRIEDEQIQLNEDTVWAGAPQERDIQGAFQHLPEIRKMLFDGRYVEAERKIEETIMGERISPKGYQTLGDLWLDSAPLQSPSNYRRELDLETGVTRTEWTERGVTFSREVFSSVPHDVLVVRIEADHPGSISTRVRLDRVADAETTAAGIGYAELRESHVADHSAIFNRVSLNLGGEDERRNPVGARLRSMWTGESDPDLLATYFQFGRYLLMASSRPGSMPANLQGIWSDHIDSPWNADYHLNINLQMNYWPADVTNLSEMQEPLWDLLDNLRVRGRKTARDHYNARGFVAHHTTDAWWWTSSAGRAQYGMWQTGAAWTSRHLWESYLFNQSKSFLRERAYPVLKEAEEFFLDWLVEDPQTGKLVSGAGWECCRGCTSECCWSTTARG